MTAYRFLNINHQYSPVLQSIQRKLLMADILVITSSIRDKEQFRDKVRNTIDNVIDVYYHTSDMFVLHELRIVVFAHLDAIEPWIWDVYNDQCINNMIHDLAHVRYK